MHVLQHIKDNCLFYSPEQIPPPPHLRLICVASHHILQLLVLHQVYEKSICTAQCAEKVQEKCAGKANTIPKRPSERLLKEQYRHDQQGMESER